MNQKIYKIRAHHGMCLYFYKGVGYSEEFTKNMTFIKQDLENNSLVKIVKEVDDICIHCPNNINGICNSNEKVIKYDKGVLENCKIEENTIMEYFKFKDLVYNNILLQNKRTDICGSCQWNSICVFKEKDTKNEN